ncbi:MAG: hypothetical protein P4M11_10315, partial [Candidatus Pacebacteria bacterium]|nr:hypothetical protein [Candidatus Paceibacterota bacterium]
SSIEAYSVQATRALKISKKDLALLRQALEDLWKKCDFVEEHRAAYRVMLGQMTLYESAVEIVKEMEEIEKGREPLQVLQKEASKREETLGEVAQFTGTKLLAADTGDVHTTAVGLLARLRKDTYNVLAGLKRWRERLGPHGAGLQFVRGGENYMLKIEGDWKGVVQGEMSKLFDFDKEKSDVLFISPRIIQIKSAYFKYNKLQSSPPR